jgi:hypothetical protein
MGMTLSEFQNFYFNHGQEIEDYVKSYLERPTLKAILSFTPTKKRFIRQISTVIGEKLGHKFINSYENFDEFDYLAKDIANYIRIHYSDNIGDCYDKISQPES